MACTDCVPSASGWIVWMIETGITAPFFNTDLVQQAVAIIRNLRMFGDLSVPQLSLASNTSPDSTSYAATYRIAFRAPVRVARVVLRTAVTTGTSATTQTPRPVCWGGIKVRAGGECGGALASYAWSYPTSTSFYTDGPTTYAELVFATPVGTFVGPAAVIEISGNLESCCPDVNYAPNTVAIYQIRLNPPADGACGGGSGSCASGSGCSSC